MTFKSGVQIRGIRPEIAVALSVASLLRTDVVCTSVTEGKHSRGSLHYVGAACDLRTRHLAPPELASFVRNLRGALTEEFDVVAESDHIHIEFQPKEP